MYGEQLADFVEHDIVRHYPLIDLSIKDLDQAIKNAESVKRELKNMESPTDPHDRINLRRLTNLNVGIYTKKNANY
jgi:hypothetical protein